MSHRTTPLALILVGTIALLGSGCQTNSTAKSPVVPPAHPVTGEASSQDLFAGRIGEAVASTSNPLQDDNSTRDLASDLSKAYAAWKQSNKT